jgi:O-Antigen ligase
MIPDIAMNWGGDRIRLALVWLIFAGSFVVIFEPAPTDCFFFLAFLGYLFSGMNYNSAIMPMMLLLLLYNLGGFLSYAIVAPTPEAFQSEFTSLYMAVSAVFIASFLSVDTEKRFGIIISGYVLGATIAAALAMLAYVFASTIGKLYISLGANDLINYGRATGLFKDPNVFSTYLVFPCVVLAQRLLLGTSRRPVVDLMCFALIFVSLFLAFSRGAWTNIFMSIMIMVALTFVLSESNAMRSRIVFYFFVGAVIVAIPLLLILSSPEMQAVFLDRFTLVKSYDAGERGRFGNQLNAIPMLLERPFGFGPLQFSHYFPEAPHNTFLNSFSSYGWLGGISYIALIGCNLFVGIRTVFTKSPYQTHAILVFACLTAVTFQGIQIDTEHWRHFYWMLGMMWGLFAATMIYKTQEQVEAAIDGKQPPYYEVQGSS